MTRMARLMTSDRSRPDESSSGTLITFAHDSPAAELCQKWHETIDGLIVRRAVTREDAIVVLQVFNVVTHPFAEDIGQPSAGLLENDLWHACVPELCSRAEMDIDVAHAFRNESYF